MAAACNKPTINLAIKLAIMNVFIRAMGRIFSFCKRLRLV
jgi:hypothetical protein